MHEKSYRRLMRYGALLIWIVFVLHVVAMKFTLYWTFDWFDVLMHALGGLVIGFIVAALVIKYATFEVPHKLFFILSIASLTLLVGLGWELFEYAIEVITRTPLHLQPSIADTLADLSLDTVGGIVSGGIGWYTFYYGRE